MQVRARHIWGRADPGWECPTCAEPQPPGPCAAQPEAARWDPPIIIIITTFITSRITSCITILRLSLLPLLLFLLLLPRLIQCTCIPQTGASVFAV